jgi:hypothetical protein
MIPVEEIIQKLLIDLEAVGDPDDLNAPQWPCYANAEPDSPDNCLTLIGTAGITQGRLQVSGCVPTLEGLQVRCRCNDPTLGYSKLWAIQQILDETVYRNEVEMLAEDGTVPTVYLVENLARQGTILRLGQDQENHSRYLFTVNYLVALSLMEE